MGKFGLVSAIFSGCGPFEKKKETCLCGRTENKFTLDSYWSTIIYIYIPAYFPLHCERYKEKNYPRRLTAVELRSGLKSGRSVKPGTQDTQGASSPLRLASDIQGLAHFVRWEKIAKPIVRVCWLLSPPGPGCSKQAESYAIKPRVY